MHNYMGFQLRQCCQASPVLVLVLRNFALEVIFPTLIRFTPECYIGRFVLMRPLIAPLEKFQLENVGSQKDNHST